GTSWCSRATTSASSPTAWARRSSRRCTRRGSGSREERLARSRRLGRDGGGALQQASRAVPVVLGQEALADAVGLRRDLEELVVGEELDRIVEREFTDSVELRGDVRVAAAHVREVLFAHHVHLESALAA